MTRPAPAGRNIRLLIAYDGSRFHGWQRQSGSPSVQQALEDAFRRISGQPAAVAGCGRTDRGVHAAAYVANCRTALRLDPPAVVRALNAVLPPGIVVRRAADAPASFHSRFDAVSKTYRYVVADAPSPFVGGFAAVVRGPLDDAAMRRGAAVLVGTHDFSAFRAAGSAAMDPVRTVSRISIARRRFPLDAGVRLLTVDITADGFLYRMARNIVGALLETGRGRLSPEDVRTILEGRDRTKAPPPAPACGLFLVRARYGRGRRRP